MIKIKYLSSVYIWLCFSEQHWIRCEVAEIGRDKDLDVLVKDKEFTVVLEVLKHNRKKDIDFLKNSDDFIIQSKLRKLNV